MRSTWIAIVATVALMATAVGHGQERRRPIRGRASAPRGAATHLLRPDDFFYLGAFRLPGPSGGSNWSYSGYAMAPPLTGIQVGRPTVIPDRYSSLATTTIR